MSFLNIYLICLFSERLWFRLQKFAYHTCVAIMLLKRKAISYYRHRERAQITLLNTDYYSTTTTTTTTATIKLLCPVVDIYVSQMNVLNCLSI